jgi:HSP20 family protein
VTEREILYVTIMLHYIWGKNIIKGLLLYQKVYIVIDITYCQVNIRMWTDPWGFSNKIFEEMDKEFSNAEDMLTRLFRTVKESGTKVSESFPYYYGYQITVGPDGKPHIREFGNARPASKGLVQQSTVREPLVDTNFDEKENTFIITAEMPGITKQDVKVGVEGGLVTIHAENGQKKYHSELPVDNELDADTAKATYTNGILELRIKLKKAPKAKTKEIKVE